MSVRPTKRPRTRSVARKEREEAPTLASVLLPIVQQGFLGHQELGHLGQTSRQLNKQCNEELWKTLCCCHWPSTSQLSSDEIISLCGYSGWFRRRICTIPEHPNDEPPPLDPPSLKAEDVMVFVDITRGGESLHSGIFSGSLLAGRFLENGSVNLGFVDPGPVVLGNASCFLQGACNCESQCRFNLIEDDFNVTMHLYRSDGTVSRIYQSMKLDPRYCCLTDGTPIHFPADESEERWKNSDSNYMALGPGVPNEQLGLPLRWTPMAAEIHRRLRGAAICFEIAPFVQIIEQQGREVAAITGFQIDALKCPIGGTEYTRFESKVEAKKHGVTLLHILQELQSV